MDRRGEALLPLGLLAALSTGGCVPRPLPSRFTETVRAADGSTVAFTLVLVPGGSFRMGSPADEPGRQADEGPPHTVRLAPFYLATTEATFDLFFLYWDEVMRSRAREFRERRERWRKSLPREQQPDPARPWKLEGCDNLRLAAIYCVDGVTGPTEGPYGDFTMGWGDAGRRPIIGLTWFAAVDFCRWLRDKTGRAYRLPTEAEWEYACRAGSTTAYSFGHDPDDLDDHAWLEDNADEMTHPVGLKRPNAWGLYDMHGNVMEWCHDFYDPQAYARRAKDAPVQDPKGPRKPVGEGIEDAWRRYHVARGGSWQDPPRRLRSAARDRERPSWRYRDPQYPRDYFWLPMQGHIGFRVVCEPESLKKK